MTWRVLLAAVSALLTSALLPWVADSSSSKVQDLRTLSGPSPFRDRLSRARTDPLGIITGAEVEPAIAVNPANPGGPTDILFARIKPSEGGEKEDSPPVSGWLVS